MVEEEQKNNDQIIVAPKIKFFKLLSGESILASIVHVHENGVILNIPCKIITASSQNSESVNYGLTNFAEMSSDQNIILNSKHIMFMSDVEEGGLHLYTKFVEEYKKRMVHRERMNKPLKHIEPELVWEDKDHPAIKDKNKQYYYNTDEEKNIH